MTEIDELLEVDEEREAELLMLPVEDKELDDSVELAVELCDVMIDS